MFAFELVFAEWLSSTPSDSVLRFRRLLVSVSFSMDGESFQVLSVRSQNS